ncbi:MAG: ABC transporter substrate-binding protein [Proteobacteria bacterium]|nr:ABC transporter substrate-binding protein [Pseudomonadota bacterium]
MLTLADTALAEERCARIVSLAPSITETLFALGLGQNVVGVSRFCAFPPEVKQLPTVGGFLDPHYEAIARLKPTAVFYPKEFGERVRELQALSIPIFPIDQRTRAGIRESIGAIAALCGKEAAGKALQVAIDHRTEEIAAKVFGRPRVRGVVLVGSESISSIRSLYVSGQDGFYDELIRLAGGENLISGRTKPLALEALVSLNPEVIVAIHPDYPDEAEGSRKALAAWSEFQTVAAVQHQRIHVLSAPSSYIPGPRYTELLERLAKLFHPEVF